MIYAKQWRIIMIATNYTPRFFLQREYEFYIKRLRARGIETSLTYEEWVKQNKNS